MLDVSIFADIIFNSGKMINLHLHLHLYILFEFNLESIEDWGIFFSNLSSNNNGMKKTVNKDV